MKKDKKKKSTNKKLVWFLFANCTILELVVLWVTVKSFVLAESIMSMPDFSPLVTLIGLVVGEAITYAVYALKSAKENSIGGITYDMAMRDRDEAMDYKGEDVEC